MASAFNGTLRSSDISVPGAFDISHSLGSDRSRTDSKHRNFDDIAARIFELGLVSRQRAGYAVGARKSASLHLSLNPNLFIEPESRALCVTAIGGGEPSPPSTGGKVWTMTVVMIGWGVLTYTLLALMSYVLEGHLGIAIKMRRMHRQVARTNNHFVLCGYGRVGSEIARDFHSEKIGRAHV